MRFPSYIGAVIPALATIVVLTGCHGGSDDSPVVRGTVTPPALSVLDGDTNNPGDRLAPNDTVDDAQNLPNPATVVGYVTAQADSGAVSGARFAERADPDDYYRIALAQGHGVNLVIADSTAADLDLFLLNPDGSPAASSMGSTATESVSAPADGDYIVQVHANTVTGSSGSSNYFLSLGQGVQALQQQVMRMEDDFVPGEVIVRYRNAAAPSGTLSTLSGAPGRAMLLGLGQGTQRRASLQALDLTGPAVDAGRHHPLSASQQARADTILATKALRRRANVAWAGLNHRVYPAAIPNDPRYDQQWNLPILNMADAWDEIQPGDGDVVVAVVDTGIVPTHPDLNDNLDLVDGYDFIANTLYSGDGDGLDDDPSVPGLDGDFHGTHVSGIVAAETDNGVGVAGVAGPSGKVRIMPLRALGQAGGTEYDVLQAVRYALGLDNDSGKLPAETAQIVNMSLGGTTGSLADAFAAIQTASDAVLVAAAGNSGANSLLFPAGYRGVVAVGATTDTDAIADYSNYGEALDVVAPGGTSTNPIVSTWGDTDGNPGTTADMYASEAGTSMATPHVSGVAA
ncbi:MAG: S8 family serine peptidase, partial [Ectothiorhodospiraceae bacterium]